MQFIDTHIWMQNLSWLSCERRLVFLKSVSVSYRILFGFAAAVLELIRHSEVPLVFFYVLPFIFLEKLQYRKYRRFKINITGEANDLKIDHSNSQ